MLLSNSYSHPIDNIQPGQEHNFRKLSTSRATSLGTPYDAVSIMHYRAWSFSTNRGRTLQSKHGIPLGGPELSPTDVKQARLLYNCPTGKVYCCPYACTLYWACISCASNIAEDHSCKKASSRQWCTLMDVI